TYFLPDILASTTEQNISSSRPSDQRSQIGMTSKIVARKIQYRKVDDMYFSSQDRKSTRLNSSHVEISYAVFCLKKKKKKRKTQQKKKKKKKKKNKKHTNKLKK